MVRTLKVRIRGAGLTIRGSGTFRKGEHLIAWHLDGKAARVDGVLTHQWCNCNAVPTAGILSDFTRIGKTWAAMSNSHRGRPKTRWFYVLTLTLPDGTTYKSTPCPPAKGGTAGNPNIRNN